MTNPPLLLCFQLSQLLAFYLSLVSRSVGQAAQLSTALRSCRDMATRVFFEQLRTKGDKLLRTPPAPPKDLSPPPEVFESVHTLLDIISAFESALQSSHSGSDAAAAAAASQDELAPVLAAALNPLIETCERSAEALTPDAPSRVDEVAKLDPAAHRIYLINCLLAITSALSARRVVLPRVQQLSDVIEGHISALVGGEVGRLLARCGLAEVLERLRLYQQPRDAPNAPAAPSGSPSSDPELSLPRIADAMRSFFVLVSTPDALPEFLQIQAPRTRADAVARVGKALVDAYELVWRAVDDPSCGYLEQGGVSAIKHTPAQVNTILGVV